MREIVFESITTGKPIYECYKSPVTICPILLTPTISNISFNLSPHSEIDNEFNIINDLKNINYDEIIENNSESYKYLINSII